MLGQAVSYSSSNFQEGGFLGFNGLISPRRGFSIPAFQCSRSLNAATDSMQPLTQSSHSLNAVTHSIQSLTQCSHPLNATTHSMQSLTQCSHSLNAATHSMQSLTFRFVPTRSGSFRLGRNALGVCIHMTYGTRSGSFRLVPTRSERVRCVNSYDL